MGPMKNNKSIILRISLTFAFLVFLLVVVNSRVDFHPNSIFVDAEFEEHYLEPDIHLNLAGDDNHIQINPGDVKAALLEDVSALRIDFLRKKLLTEEDFFLIDHNVDNETQTSVWFATLPQGYIANEGIRTFLLQPRDQTASYSFIINETEWPLSSTDGSLIAEKPSTSDTDPASITIIKKEYVEKKLESGELFPGIVSVVPLTDDLGLIRIKSISFVHSFGRVGIHVPLLSLNAEDIYTSFTLIGCGENYSIDESSLNIRGDKTRGCSLEFTDSIPSLSQRIMLKVNLYSILSNIAVFILSIAFCAGLPLLLNKIKLPGYDFGSNFNFVSFTSLIFFSLGVIFSFVGNIQTQQTLLLICFVVFIFSIILNSIFKIPIDKTFDQKISRLISWDYCLLISLLIFSIIALFYRLGSFNFNNDEFQVIEAAAGYLKTGQFARWDWINETLFSPYSRAWPHTYLIAQSFRIFGISEWSARLPSVLFGIGFFIFFYFFTRFFTNKQIASLSLLSAVFFSWNLRIFRFTRMYALLIPLSLLLAYCLYQFITGEIKPNTGSKSFDNLFGKFLNFDYKYLLISIPLLYLNYLIHVNSLIIVLAMFAYVCVLAVIEKRNKYIILSIFGILLGPVVLLVINFLTRSGIINYSNTYMPRFLHFFNAFGMRRFEYLNYLLDHPFGVVAGFSSVVFMAYILLNSTKDSEFFRKYLYLFMILITSAVFFIFLADRVAWYFYISHITPVALILIISGFWYFNGIHLKFPVFMVIILTFIILNNFIRQVPDLYFGKNGNGNFSEAYQVIIEEYDYDDEVIFGQYLRTYYLQELDDIRVVSMQNNQTYTFEQFMKDLETYQKGWITWETQKSYHVADEIVFFVDQYFSKYHGSLIDNTNVEVYYFSWTDLDYHESQ